MGLSELAEIEDSALVKRIAERDAEALNEMLSRYQHVVFSTALYLLKDSALAEDLAMSVFTWVWDKARDYQPERAKVSIWLLMITRNRAIDQLRRQTARGQDRQVSWSGFDIADDSSNLEIEVEERLQKDRLRSAIAALPPEQSEVLALAYFHGLTQQEIADRQGLPLGTVKTRIRLALQKLRESLVEEKDTSAI
jgi:RNA polymerase sigma factor (sigma-70 family)